MAGSVCVCVSVMTVRRKVNKRPCVGLQGAVVVRVEERTSDDERAGERENVCLLLNRQCTGMEGS